MTNDERLDALEMQVQFLRNADDRRVASERLRDLRLDNTASRVEDAAYRLPKLEDGLTVLSHAQRLHEESVAEHKLWLAELSQAYVRTEERFRELREEAAQRDRAMDERIARLIGALDERIGRLVSAIGELLPRKGAA